MSPYASLNLKIDVAARAREIAFARGVTLAGLFSDLINRAYTETFGADALKNVELQGDKVLLKLRGDGDALHLTASRVTALTFASTLKNLATGSASTNAHLNLDSACMLLVMRKGRGVIIEATMPDGQRIRKTMAARDASLFADEISASLK